MAVELDGDIHSFLDALHDRVGVIGVEKAGHVLKADGVGTHLYELLRLLGVHVWRVDGTDRVADGALGVAARLLDGFDGGLEVAKVVDGVEDAEDVHAVLNRELAELIDDIVGVVAVAYDVLAAEQHLEGRLLEALLELAQALPGVLAEKAEGGVEGGAAPDLDAVEAGLVHLGRDGDHVLGAHARGEQRLVAVAHGGVGDFGGHGVASVEAGIDNSLRCRRIRRAPSVATTNAIHAMAGRAAVASP